MLFERPIEPYQPLLDALAVPDQKCIEALSEEDVLALQVGNLRDSQSCRQGKVYDELIPDSNFVATGDYCRCLFPRCLEQLVYFFPGEEFAGIQMPTIKWIEGRTDLIITGHSHSIPLKSSGHIINCGAGFKGPHDRNVFCLIKVESERFLCKYYSSDESRTSNKWESDGQIKIIDESFDIKAALNKYFFRFGHLSFSGKLSIVNLIDKWQSKHGRLYDIWTILWAWTDSFTIPLPRYHVCAYFISNPDLAPVDNHTKLWHEIVEIVHMPNNEEEDLEWTQAWRMFCEIARHYCCHLEARLPFMIGERIASRAWWLSVQVCKLLTSNKKAVEQLRNETFLPELTLSSRIWQIASLAIKPSSLRFLTLNTNSLFSLSLHAMLVNNLYSLKPSSMTPEDRKRFEHVISGSILGIFPPKIVDNSEKVYAYEDSVLITAKKWLPL